MNLKYQVQYGQKPDLPDGSYEIEDIQDYFLKMV